MIDIKKSLETLGIKDVNFGASTGLDCFGAGGEITSYSPVDGKLIATTTDTVLDIKTQGIYFIKIITEKGIAVKKIVIE